jgi:hypothetical protein
MGIVSLPGVAAGLVAAWERLNRELAGQMEVSGEIGKTELGMFD